MSVGIIGVGNWGRKLLERFSKLDEVKYFYTSGKIDNVQFMKEHYLSIQFDTIDNIVKNDDVDKIVLATPINTHYELCKKALEHKKHVFIEKPLAISYKEACELDLLAIKNNCVLFVGHKFIHHPVINKIKEIDKIHNFNVKFFWEKWGTFTENIYWNLLIHDVALCLEIFNDKVVDARALNVYSGSKDRAAIQLNCASGRIIKIEHNRRSKNKNKIVSLFSTTNVGKDYKWQDDELIYIPKNTISAYFDNVDLVDIECKKFLEYVKTNMIVDNKIAIEAVRIMENVLK